MQCLVCSIALSAIWLRSLSTVLDALLRVSTKLCISAYIQDRHVVVLAQALERWVSVIRRVGRILQAVRGEGRHHDSPGA